MTKLKIVSNNKVRANRENAKKSTGPRTVSGKEKVSGNALSHGLTAEKHVIIGESIEEFNTFKNSMFNVYEPFGAYEEEIFIKLVELLWRLRRVGVIETGIYGNEILEYDADTYKPQASNKITHSDFKEGDQNKVLKNQSLIGVEFTRDSNAGSSLLKLNTIEGRLISRVQLFEDLLLKVQKRRGLSSPCSLKNYSRFYAACFFLPMKYNKAKATIKIPGNINMFDKVACPAAKSAASPTKPVASAAVLLSLIHPPMMGWNIDEENIPIPPMIDKPNAPVCGKC